MGKVINIRPNPAVPYPDCIKQVVKEQQLKSIGTNVECEPPGRNGVPRVEFAQGFAHQLVDSDEHENVNSLASKLRMLIIEQYMLKCHVFEMTDEELFKGISKSNLDHVYLRMSAIANRIMKNGRSPYLYRINTKVHSVYIKFLHIDKDDSGNRHCDINVQIYNKDDKYMIATTFMLFVGVKGLIDLFLGPFVYAKDPAYAKKVLTDLFNGEGKFPPGKPVPVVSDMTSIFIMYNAMEKIYREVCTDKPFNVEDITYSDFEMDVYRDMTAREFGEEVKDSFATNLIGVHNPEYDYLMQDSLCTPNAPKYLYIPPVVNTIPKIAFSQKEISRTLSYIEKTGMGPSKDNPINLTKILTTIKYGSWFRFSTPFISAEDGEMYLHWDCYQDYNWVRFYMIRYNSNGTSVYALIDFCDTDAFTGPSNLSNINVDLMWGDVSKMENSVKGVIDTLVPTVMKDTTDITYMMLGFIKIFIMMAERPTRTKVLRVLTPKAEVEEEQKVRRYRRVYEEPTDPEEIDYVITRILKSTTEAKKMVEEAKKLSGGSRREARYVVESWDRVGFWRRIPGTDRSVYINPTTCKRRLPLTDDKEIHIKL